MSKFWMAVASKEHVERGVELGICQFCHGKLALVKRVQKGDFIIYYSSKIKFQEEAACQKFTAIGQVIDDVPYQVDMGGGFMPYRRNVKYFDAECAEIKPLIASLDFIKNKTSWGYVFRYGFFEIDKQSFEIIASAMKCSIDSL